MMQEARKAEEAGISVERRDVQSTGIVQPRQRDQRPYQYVGPRSQIPRHGEEGGSRLRQSASRRQRRGHLIG